MENNKSGQIDRRIELYLRSDEIITHQSPVKDSDHTISINQIKSSFYSLNSREAGIKELIVRVTNKDGQLLKIYDLAYRADKTRAILKGIRTTPRLYIDGHKIDEIPDNDEDLSNLFRRS